MKAPKLPRAVFPNETSYDDIASWVLFDELGTIVNYIVHNDPSETLGLGEE
jgi:hypothetical protein